jgi:hypothetical protein
MQKMEKAFWQGGVGCAQNAEVYRENRLILRKNVLDEQMAEWNVEWIVFTDKICEDNKHEEFGLVVWTCFNNVFLPLSHP